jgi:hypothetical protein
MKSSSENVVQNQSHISHVSMGVATPSSGGANLNNQNGLNTGKSQFVKNSPGTSKPYLEAVEQYKKLCLKTTMGPNNNFLTALKQEGLSLFLENYSLKEIAITNKIIGSHFYFKQLILAPSDTTSKSRKINFTNLLNIILIC